MPEIKVMLSAAFKEAYLELVPQFERATGHKTPKEGPGSNDSSPASSIAL